MSSPSPVPVSKFREISLRRMPPTTRSRAQRQSLQTSSGFSDPSSEAECALDSNAVSEVDDDDEEEEEEDEPSAVISPSKLIYNLDRLSPEARDRVRDTFSHPPRLSLKFGLLFHDNVYAFQMTDLVHRSIRIGSPDSRWPTPSCSCMEGNAPPCQHLLWFLDQLAKQTLYDHDLTSPLTMTPGGYPKEIGDPYRKISTFHLDVWADSLHCNAFDPTTGAGEGSDSPDDSDESSDSESEDQQANVPIPHRVQEVRELLSAISHTSPEDFRPDLLSTSPSQSKRNPIKRYDLEATIFRMLLANDEFFHYFLSKMRSTDPINNPFRKLSQRIHLVLRELDAFAAGAVPNTATEGPRDVAWAARHITGVVGLIHNAIFRRDKPLQESERVSAARALVHILAGVVKRNRDFVSPAASSATTAASVSRQDRNLYFRLVGDRDQGFVLSVLDLLPPDATAPFLFTLEDIQEQLGVNGAPASYVVKLLSLLSRLRRTGGAGVASTSFAAAGSKRQSEGPDRGSKRMK